MKKFLIQLLVFTSPLIVYLVYPSYVLWQSEENFHQIDATLSENFDEESIFRTLDNVSKFFEKGSLGFSPNGKNLEGLKFETYEWKVKPLKVRNVKSSFFENDFFFPKGSIKFDNAILMENIEHEWKSVKSLKNHCS